MSVIGLWLLLCSHSFGGFLISTYYWFRPRGQTRYPSLFWSWSSHEGATPSVQDGRHAQEQDKQREMSLWVEGWGLHFKWVRGCYAAPRRWHLNRVLKELRTVPHSCWESVESVLGRGHSLCKGPGVRGRPGILEEVRRPVCLEQSEWRGEQGRGRAGFAGSYAATHSSIHAWKIPWTEEPGGLQSMGSHRVGHDWSDLAAAAYKNLQKAWAIL